MMGYSYVCLFISVIGLFSCLTLGLFEDQAGEFDWKIENIGTIQQSFSKVVRWAHMSYELFVF